MTPAQIILKNILLKFGATSPVLPGSIKPNEQKSIPDDLFDMSGSPAGAQTYGRLYKNPLFIRPARILENSMLFSSADVRDTLRKSKVPTSVGSTPQTSSFPLNRRVYLPKETFAPSVVGAHEATHYFDPRINITNYFKNPPSLEEVEYPAMVTETAKFLAQDPSREGDLKFDPAGSTTPTSSWIVDAIKKYGPQMSAGELNQMDLTNIKDFIRQLRNPNTQLGRMYALHYKDLVSQKHPSRVDINKYFSPLEGNPVKQLEINKQKELAHAQEINKLTTDKDTAKRIEDFLSGLNERVYK